MRTTQPILDAVSGRLPPGVEHGLEDRPSWSADPSSGCFTEWQQGALGRAALPAAISPSGRTITIAGRSLPMGGARGGDWYDVVALGEGKVAVALGDVVGQGDQAAAVVGELRSALRSYARTPGSSPASVVGQLNQVVLATGVGEMTTLVYIVVSTRQGTVRLTNAGHCPPLLVGPGVEARFLDGGRSCPLGVVGTHEQPEAALPFVDEMTLVLYTDGLVESRTRSLDDGLRQLRRATANGPHEPEALCDHLLEVLGQGDGPEDDIALLAIRVNAPATVARYGRTNGPRPRPGS